jgi:hypothetical protein
MTTPSFSNKAVAASFAEQFLSAYLEPAFGSRSKSEIDNLVFSLLVSCKAINPTMPTFDIARSLNITLPKARSLVMNWQLRSGELDEALRSRLVEYLQKVRFHRDGTYVAVGIGDGLVREYFIAELQRLDIFPDRTFASEIVRVPLDGFISVLEKLAGSAGEAVRGSLVKSKIVPDTSAKGILKEILVKAASKIGEKAVGKVAENAADKLGDFISSYIGGNSSEAAKATKSLLSEE